MSLLSQIFFGEIKIYKWPKKILLHITEKSSGIFFIIFFQLSGFTQQIFHENIFKRVFPPLAF